MNTILYGDKVKFKDKLGIVKDVQGSFARILFNGDKKVTMLPVDALEKIDG